MGTQSWLSMDNQTTVLSTVSLGHCALATAKNVDSQIFEYTDENRRCTMALHQEKGIEQWHPERGGTPRMLHLGRKYWDNGSCHE